MNRSPKRGPRLAALLVAALVAMFAMVASASAVTLAPTNAPLPGSNFQGGDGDQLNETVAGKAYVDWQSKAGAVSASVDDNAQDSAFEGGDKESEPGLWGFAPEAGGVSPPKDNVFSAWSEADINQAGSAPANYLYLAFNREVQNGNTYLTFELNQRGDTWMNGVSPSPIACRSTGDIFVSYEIGDSSISSINVVVYRWTTTTYDAATGCAKTGTFQQLDPQPYAQGAMAQTGITNYISPLQIGSSFAAGTFGEAALNITGIMQKYGLNPCVNFAQASLHSRSSTSIDSQLQDMLGPIPVHINACGMNIKKTGENVKHDGDSERFDYTLTNTARVAVTVNKSTGVVDDKCAPVVYDSGDLNNDGKLDVDETWKFHCIYTVKHSDENAQHKIINTVTAYGAVAGYNLQATDVWSTLVIHPAIDVTKTAAETAVHVGDTIHYTVTVKNTGDTSLSVTPADTGCASFDSSVFTLAAGASKTLNCTHVAATVDGTSYRNQACADGVDSIGGAKGTVSDCDHVDVTILHPAIDVTKTAAETAVHVGDTIHYTVTVKNTGDTSLSVTPADTGCTSFDNSVFTLTKSGTAGDTKTLNCTHVAATVDGTSYRNQACAQGIDSIGGAKGTVSDCDHVDVTILHPAIDVTKTAAETAVHVGDTIHYTVNVKNTGDTSLTVTPSDLGCDAFDSSVFTLAAGADKDLTCTHVAATVDGGSYHNEACAQGVDSIGGAKGTVSDCDHVDIPILHPGIKVEKTAGETAVHVGDTIHYTVKVTNTGDTDLTVTPSDTGCDGFDGSAFTLTKSGTAGDTKTLTCTHVAVAADGTDYDNKACADGVDSIGGAKGTVSDCDHVDIPILHPGIKVEKTAGETAVHVGDTIHYTVKVTNTGHTDLTVTPSDTGCDGFDNSVFTLTKSGTAGDTKTLTCTHVAVAADGTVKANEACADGVDSVGGAKGTVSDCDTVTTEVIHPKIKIDKTERIAGDPTYTDGPITNAFVGDTLEYEMKVTNPGDTPLDVTFTDAECDAGTLSGPTGDTNGDSKLDVSETWVYHCSHVALNADKPSVTNTAHVDGTDKLGQTVSDEDSVVAAVVDFKISGHKFEDMNANGKQDAGEPGIADWTFYLDDNGNGRLDAGEATTKTDAKGDYEFAGLNPGSYTVREVLPSGWHCSTPSPCEYSFKLSARDPDRTNADFGNWHEATVEGTKFHDRNANGARDAGEEGLAGWTFYVDYNGNARLDAGEPSAASAGDGSYKITGITPGSYAVREVGQAGWTCSFPSTCEHDVTLVSNDDKTGQDFGNWDPASISGTKFQDTNGNGQRDAGEGPLQGFTFYVDYNGNGALDNGEPAGVSGADGNYTIGGIKPGAFKVLEVADPNFTCTFPAGCAYSVTLGAGDVQTGRDFGNAPPQQLVLPERITPGKARLLGPTGCVARTFKARVRGSKVARVVFILDGKTIKRFTSKKSKKTFTVRINPRKLKVGVHRLVVSVTYQKGTGTKPKKLRLSFQRCAKRLAKPRFTG